MRSLVSRGASVTVFPWDYDISKSILNPSGARMKKILTFSNQAKLKSISMGFSSRTDLVTRRTLLSLSITSERS